MSKLTGRERAIHLLKGMGAEHVAVCSDSLYIVAKEHEDIDWNVLVRMEDTVMALLDVDNLSVRAHQGRGMDEVVPSESTHLF